MALEYERCGQDCQRCLLTFVPLCSSRGLWRCQLARQSLFVVLSPLFYNFLSCVLVRWVGLFQEYYESIRAACARTWITSVLCRYRGHLSPTRKIIVGTWSVVPSHLKGLLARGSRSVCERGEQPEGNRHGAPTIQRKRYDRPALGSGK